MQLNALLNPLKLSAAISLVGLLMACSGNSSTTTSGPSQVVTPIVVDKTIVAVEWTPENYVANSSHAYRVITKSSMLRLVFTNQLAAFDASVNLLRVDSSRNCSISGRIVAEMIPEVCYLEDGTTKTTCVTSSVKRENIQKSQGIACQDGNSVGGQYFDGFFNITAKTDLTPPSEDRNSTIISALGQAATYDANGNVEIDEFGDAILKDFTDYLFQSDTSTFFFDNEYESYVDFSTTDLICGANTFKQVEQQGMRSPEVGTQEGDGIENFYLYTKFTDLDLQSIPVEVCGDNDQQVVTYTYDFSATMASVAMGGGTGRDTAVTWPDMDISLKGTPSGTLSLIHENDAGPYDTVTVNFTVDTDDNVSVIISDTSTTTTLPLPEFLALSKPVTPEPAAE
jgi:hypothetical protein